MISKFSLELILFRDDVEDYKKLTNEDEKLSKIQYIQKIYLEIGAEYEINVSRTDIEEFNKKIDILIQKYKSISTFTKEDEKIKIDVGQKVEYNFEKGNNLIKKKVL